MPEKIESLLKLDINNWIYSNVLKKLSLVFGEKLSIALKVRTIRMPNLYLPHFVNTLFSKSSTCWPFEIGHDLLMDFPIGDLATGSSAEGSLENSFTSSLGVFLTDSEPSFSTEDLLVRKAQETFFLVHGGCISAI